MTRSNGFRHASMALAAKRVGSVAWLQLPQLVSRVFSNTRTPARYRTVHVPCSSAPTLTALSY